MSKNSSITESLGLKDQVWDEIQKIVENSWELNDTVSDTFIQSGTEIKVEEFGEVGHSPNLSQYEIKLLIAGFMIGTRKAQMSVGESLMMAHLSTIMSSGGMGDFSEFLKSLEKRKKQEED